MEKSDKMVLEASGEFPFEFFIEKAVATEENDDFILEGIASTTNLDHDHERMSESALRSMEAVINEKGVPLRVEHQHEDEAIIGKVYEARVDDRNQLHVKCRLDKSHPASSILYNSMKTGAKMGLSVGGLVKRAVRELSEKTGKMVKTFYDVALKEVSVTPRPSNFDSWLVAKSIMEKGEDGERFRKHALYNEFLFENPRLDYLQAFAKSIPDGAWHKVASQDDQTMENETEDKKKTTGDTETEKAVSRSEFTQLSGLVAKGFESMSKMLEKALTIGAHDQNSPSKDKEEMIGDKVETAKAEGEAHDQNSPDKDKPKEIGDKATKTTGNGDDENGTREKTGADFTDTEKTKKDTTDEYDLQTVERALKSMDDLTARLDKMTDDETKEKTKTTDDEKETTKTEDSEDETTKGMHPLDQLVVKIQSTLEKMVTTMEKSGRSIVGFEKMQINALREDPEFQKQLVELLKQPGFKKSVSMGTPYVRTKEGRSYALTMTEVGAPTTLEKSQKDDNKGKSFKEVFKSEFSSIREDQQ